MKPLNAWGESVEDDPDDPYRVPPEERKDTDTDPEANALLDPETGEESDDVEDPV